MPFVTWLVHRQSTRSKNQDPTSTSMIADPRFKIQCPRSKSHDPSSEIQDPRPLVKLPRSKIQDQAQDLRSQAKDPTRKIHTLVRTYHREQRGRSCLSCSSPPPTHPRVIAEPISLYLRPMRAAPSARDAIDKGPDAQRCTHHLLHATRSKSG